MKRFGLIGYPLGHSFSRTYFTSKFEQLGLLESHRYDLFEMEHLKDFPTLWEKYPELVGVNVTVPHKENVKRFLDRMDYSAEKIGAVNVIKREGQHLVGYNSDYYGFKQSVINFFKDHKVSGQAIILGTGGAAKAVEVALAELDVDYLIVSRSEANGDITYEGIHKDTRHFTEAGLIINTTPLGMHPNYDDRPDLPYDLLKPSQYLYDLVYNPEETAFMKEGKSRGCNTKNGLEMLYLQADKAWEIWNS